MPTPYPFSAGATLLASQMNSLSQLPTVSITANSTAVATHAYSRIVANGSAITYTIPDSVFEAGQVIEFHNINSTVCTIAAGAGVTLNGAAGLTVAQYQSATIYATSASSFILFESAITAPSGALVYITGATFTTSAAVTFANDTFTSTYNNYLVVMNFGSSNSSTTLGLQYRDNVGTKSTANYYSGTSGYRYNAAAADRNTNGGTSATLFGMGGSGSNATENVMFMVSNPTSATSNTVCTFYFYTDDAGGAGGCRYAVLEAHTGLVLTPSAGTITGTYRVYGIVNS